MSSSTNNPLLSSKGLSQSYPVPGSAGSLVTLVDRCWVCQGIFPGYAGSTDSSLVQEFHHVVPRAYGGTDGPTISVCSGHHTTIHHLALRLIGKRQYQDLLSSTTQPESRRLLYAAEVIQRAEEALKEDPNRILTISFGLPYSEGQKLRAASRERGHRSVASYLKALIQEDFQRLFPSRRNG